MGSPPREWEVPGGRQEVEETLAAIDARLVFYDELLTNTRQAYSDYLDAHKKSDRLWPIFQAIDDFGNSSLRDGD